jgi:pimeloyl-ACP methyl ester carboxylesterase
MDLTVNGVQAFVATGGRDFDAKQPAVVLIHGAGFDHSAWALHSRWFAHHASSVLVPDLPGHGRSAGPALRSIAEMADWISALLAAVGAARAHLIGHSMGSLIALETAARHPDKVSALGLIGTAATMTVGPDLLKAAEANDAAAIDMVSIGASAMPPSLAEASHRDYGCMPARNAHCSIALPACSTRILPPATPIPARSQRRPRSRCPPH